MDSTLHLEFKADFQKGAKLSDIRQKLIESINSFKFQNYSNEIIHIPQETTISISELYMKPENKQSKEKLEKELKSPDHDNTEFNFLFMKSKNIEITNRPPLGEGGFGTVYHGKCKTFEVAIKVMKNYNKDKFFKEVLVTHYLRSIRSLAIIGLEKVEKEVPKELELVDVKKKPPVFNMVLEFINGSSLTDLIRDMTAHGINAIKHPRNEIMFILYALDLAKGIDFLARRKIIHRDLKPDNCMLNKELDLFVIDFGIAKEQKHDQTQTNETGTMLYYPPENALDTDEQASKTFATGLSTDVIKRKISSAFDMWCFGLIISEMFGLEAPWGDPTRRVNVMIKHAGKTKFPIPSGIEMEIIRMLIDNCTKFHPQERINISDTIKILTTLLQERLIHHSKYLNLDNLFSSQRQQFKFNNKIKLVFDAVDDKKTLNLDNGYVFIGNLLKEQGNIKSAEDYFKKALQYNKNNFAVYNSYGNIYEIQTKFVEAKAYYEKAIELNANSDVAYNNLGNLLINLNAFDKANNYLQLARQIDPNNYLTYLNLGKLNERLKKYTDAEEYYKLAKEKAPTRPESYTRLGYLYNTLGRKQEALACYKLLVDQYDKFNENSYILLANQIWSMKNEKDLLPAFNKGETSVSDQVRNLYTEAFWLNKIVDDRIELIIGYLLPMDPAKTQQFMAKKKQLESARAINKTSIFTIKELIKCYDSQLNEKTRADKTNKFNQQVQILNTELSNLMQGRDTEKYQIETLLENRFDNHIETEELLKKAIKLNPLYKDNYIYLAKVYKLQDRICQLEMMEFKYLEHFDSPEDRLRFKSEVFGISQKANESKEDNYLNEITLKKHLTENKLINPTTELQKIGEDEKVHYDEEEPNKLQSIVWKSAKFDSEDIVIRFFNLKKYPDEIPQFLSYLNVFQTLKITECDRIPEFYGICYEQEKDDSNVSFGLMFRYLEGDTLREYLKKNPKYSLEIR